MRSSNRRSTFVLVPGADGDPRYWHRVEPLLREAGQAAVSVRLPVDDPSAGLQAHADAVRAVVDGREDVVLVAQSLGAQVAPLACDAAPIRRLVLVAPMIPAPGETGGEWWTTSGQTSAAREADLAAGRDPDAPFDPWVTFLHDVPAAVVQALGPPAVPRFDRLFAEPWPLRSWPGVPTRVVAGRHDRLFPLPFVIRLARDRLGLEPEVLDCGHLAALARPVELVEQLLAPGEVPAGR